MELSGLVEKNDCNPYLAKVGIAASADFWERYIVLSQDSPHLSPNRMRALGRS